MNIGRAQAVFVNKTGGGVTIDNIAVPSGFVVSSVISPTGTTLSGSSKYKGTWVNHEETIKINFKMSYTGFNLLKTGNATISYTCEDDSKTSHAIAMEGSMTIGGSFPSKLMSTIAFHNQRPRGHLLIKDETNRVYGYPTYKDKSGRAMMYVSKHNNQFHWHYSYDGEDLLYYTQNLISTSSNSGMKEYEALRSFPLDCSYYGNTHLNYGEDTGKKYRDPKESGTHTNSKNLNDYSYMQWYRVNTTARGKVRFLFIQNVDSVGWKKDTSSTLNEGTKPNTPIAQLRTDKSSSNRTIQLRTNNPGNKYRLREWFIHGPDGRAARIITQYGNVDIDTTRIGFGDYGASNMEGYCRYREIHVRDECNSVSSGSNPSGTYSRMSKWSDTRGLPNYNFTIKKNGTDTGKSNGWAAGQLTNNGHIYQDCGYDTKYTIVRSKGGEVKKVWYNEGATPSSNSNWSGVDGIWQFNAPQGNNIKAHGRSRKITFKKNGIPGEKWRVKAYVMAIGSWDHETGSVYVNGKEQLTFRSHGYTMKDVVAKNGASFSFKSGNYSSAPTAGEWSHGVGKNVWFVSDWFTGGSAEVVFNFNYNQGVHDENGCVSHMQIETSTTDSGGTQPLIDINRHVVMGVNQNKTGILKANTYNWQLFRGHNSTASGVGTFKIVSSSKTASASTYISNNNANWGAVGVDKGTYFTGWQCCESGKGLGSYCNLYSPEDEIKDVNGWGINELRKVEARHGTEVYVIRNVCRANSSSRFGWYTTSFGSNGLNNYSTKCWGCTVKTGRRQKVWVEQDPCVRRGRSWNCGSWVWKDTYPNQVDYGKEKKQLTIKYTNPTEESLQVEVPFRCHSFSDDYLTWSLYVYNHTTKQLIKSPKACGKPPAQNGNPPGHWGNGDAATKAFGSFNGTITWRATIPPKTTYEFYPGACLGHGWCQAEGGAAYWIGLEPKKFVK